MKKKEFLLHTPKMIVSGVILALLLIAGCSKDDKKDNNTTDPVEEYDREVMLTNYADAYILPAYSAYTSGIDSLKAAAINFNSTLNVTSLNQLRIKWENALLLWQDVGFLEFGPAQNISLRSQTNVYPIDTVLVTNNIAAGSYNLQLASNFDAKGLQAVEYLINGTGNNDNDIVTYFSNTTNASTYLIDVITDLETNANYVNNEWISTYRSNFIANSASNAQGSSVSDIVNAISLHYETFIRKGKIGLPAGVFNGFSQLPMPEHVEAYHYEQSLPFVYRSLVSLQKFIKGEHYASSVNGEGLEDYLNFVRAQSGGQPLSTLINNQFINISGELANINDPLSNEVVNNNQGVRDVYQQMQQMVPFIKVETANALDVMITYQDNDGD
ncbi:MAG TPA: imelysin family protein [Vicingaceae bacterium]|nr:imelysin family protein [Vicingaceae bacterium]